MSNFNVLCLHIIMTIITCKKDLYQTVAEITFKVLIAFLGSLLNIAIYITLLRTRKLRSNNTHFLCSLSLAGLFFSVFSSPLSSVIAFKWFQGKCSWELVLVNRIIYSIGFCASISTLTLMSLERSYVICNPLKYKQRMTETKAKASIGGIWVVSMVVGFTEGVHLFTDVVQSILTITAVVLCYVIIVICYIFMFLTIRRQRKVHHDLGSRGKTVVNIRRKTERELAKTIGLIIGVFAITWSPIAYTLAVSPHLDRKGGDGLKSHWSLAVGMASAVLNPLIYFFRSREFRKALKEATCARGCMSFPCVAEQHSTAKSADASTVVGKSLPIELSNRSNCVQVDKSYHDMLSHNNSRLWWQICKSERSHTDINCKQIWQSLYDWKGIVLKLIVAFLLLWKLAICRKKKKKLLWFIGHVWLISEVHEENVWLITHFIWLYIFPLYICEFFWDKMRLKKYFKFNKPKIKIKNSENAKIKIIDV